MVNYQYLGYGITDENGIAKLDHDANGDLITHSYTGTGAGEIDIVASLDDTITESSIQSEIFAMLDCLWYDDCLPSTHNTNWFNRNNLLTEYTSNGLTLVGGANSGNYMPNKDGTATSIADVTEWIPSFAFEFDIIEFSNASNISVGISTIGRNLSQLGITDATHLRIVYDGSTVKYYKDYSATETYSANLTTSPVYINIGVATGHSITIKDVKIYPV